MLIVLMLLSCQPAILSPLIDARQATQGIYRQLGEVLQTVLNGPLPPTVAPILVVKLDDDSLQAANASKDPIDRAYLAKLMQKSIDLNIPTVGVDYVLKDQMPNQEAIQALLNRSGDTRFVLGASSKWGVANLDVIKPENRIDGDIDVNDISRPQSTYPVFLARTIGDPTNIRDSNVRRVRLESNVVLKC